MDVHIRSIDENVWRAIRIEAVRRGITVGEMIEELWRLWEGAKDRARI